MAARQVGSVFSASPQGGSVNRPVDRDLRYSSEAVQQILETAMATTQAHSVTRQQLLEMAAELAIDPLILEHSEQEWHDSQQREQRRKRWRRHLRWQWLIFGLVNSGLVVINLLTYSQVFWAIYPILGWGLSLTLMSAIPVARSGRKPFSGGARSETDPWWMSVPCGCTKHSFLWHSPYDNSH